MYTPGVACPPVSAIRRAAAHREKLRPISPPPKRGNYGVSARSPAQGPARIAPKTKGPALLPAIAAYAACIHGPGAYPAFRPAPPTSSRRVRSPVAAKISKNATEQCDSSSRRHFNSPREALSSAPGEVR